MGYAVSIPSGLTSVTSGGRGTTSLGLSTVPANTSCGSIVTPNYKLPLTRASCDIRIQGRLDTSGATNYIDTASGMYIGLNDGSTFSCGTFTSTSLRTPANTFVGECLIRGVTNIASELAPNTTYTCQIMFGRALADLLMIYNPSFELNLFFGSD